MGKKMDRRVEKTKHAIKEAYFGILMEGRGKKLTITEIARRANIDRKTFYLHYGSVEDIIREFTKEKVEEIVRSLKEVIVFEDSFRIKQVFERLNKAVYENLEVFEFLSKNKEYDYFIEQMRKMLVQIVVESGGKYFSMQENELKFYAEFFVSGIISAYTFWLSTGMPISIDEMSDNVSIAAMQGLKGILAGKMKVEG